MADVPNLGGQLNQLSSLFQTLGMGPGITGMGDQLNANMRDFARPEYDPMNPQEVKKQIAWLSSRGRNEEAMALAQQLRALQSDKRQRSSEARQQAQHEVAMQQAKDQMLKANGLKSLNAMKDQWMAAKKSGDTQRMSLIEESMRSVAVQTGQTEDVVSDILLKEEVNERAKQEFEWKKQDQAWKQRDDQIEQEKLKLIDVYFKVKDNAEALQEWIKKAQKMGHSPLVAHIQDQENQRLDYIARAQQAREDMTDLTDSEYLNDPFFSPEVRRVYEKEVRDRGVVSANNMLERHINSTLATQESLRVQTPPSIEQTKRYIEMLDDNERFPRANGPWYKWDTLNTNEKKEVAYIAHNIARNRPEMDTMEKQLNMALDVYFDTVPEVPKKLPGDEAEAVDNAAEEDAEVEMEYKRAFGVQYQRPKGSTKGWDRTPE